MRKTHDTRGQSCAERRDHYQEVTDKVIAALERGTKPWRQPWDDNRCGGPELPVNGATGRAYHGINVLVLAMSSFAFGGGDPRFCTYKQAAERGWQVRKGERGTQVFFFKRLQVTDEAAAPEAEHRTRHVPLLKAHTVFHASQLDGVPPYVAPGVVEAPWRRPEAAALILGNSGATIRTGGNRAFYVPSADYINLPNDGAFDSPFRWAAVVLHEASHWAGGPDRLNRDLSGRFGSRSYAAEELVAELASVFIGAVLGLPCDIPDHADYVAEWITILRGDRREIFRAAAAAQKAADYLLAFHPDYAHAAEAAGDPDSGAGAPVAPEMRDAA